MQVISTPKHAKCLAANLIAGLSAWPLSGRGVPGRRPNKPLVYIDDYDNLLIFYMATVIESYTDLLVQLEVTFIYIRLNNKRLKISVYNLISSAIDLYRF
jgi:hypothetical protein